MARITPGWQVKYFKNEKNLLDMARISTCIWAPISAIIATYNWKTSGYLLVVAFDIMLAGSVVPLFACFYWKKCAPYAAFMSMFCGSLCRVILEGECMLITC